MGSGGGKSDSQQVGIQRMPAWELPTAKEYLSSLAQLIFPGTNQNIKGSAGMSNPAQGATGAGQAGGGNQQIPSPGLDPSFAYNFAAPMASGSPYLNSVYQTNPNLITGAFSPASAGQFNQIYSNMGLG